MCGHSGWARYSPGHTGFVFAVRQASVQHGCSINTYIATRNYQIPASRLWSDAVIATKSRKEGYVSKTDELLENNRRYAEVFGGQLPMPPAAGVAVVACMDARISVYGILGLQEGEAHVIRNAGGVITDDQIRSLAISQRLLGTREIVL